MATDGNLFKINKNLVNFPRIFRVKKFLDFMSVCLHLYLAIAVFGICPFLLIKLLDFSHFTKRKQIMQKFALGGD